MKEIDKLRAKQTRRVMPLIGPLLDAWEGTHNDLKGEIEELEPALFEQLQNLAKAVEFD